MWKPASTRQRRNNEKTVVVTDFVTEPTIEREVLGPDVDIVCLNETNEDKYPDIIHEASALWYGMVI